MIAFVVTCINLLAAPPATPTSQVGPPNIPAGPPLPLPPNPPPSSLPHASHSYGFLDSVMNAGISEQLVMLILAVFSVVSWAIIAHKIQMLRQAQRSSGLFLQRFWDTKRLDEIYDFSENNQENNPVAKVFRAGYIELAKLKQSAEGKESRGDMEMGSLESIERSMRRTAAAELTHMEALISFLGTTGATAPFIGLLGTVIGIMSAFQRIGLEKNAGLDTVAPGIGGALVATAFGLFAAIPAVIAYNHFLSRIRVLETEMDNFSADFLNIIKRHFF